MILWNQFETIWSWTFKSTFRSNKARATVNTFKLPLIQDQWRFATFWSPRMFWTQFPSNKTQHNWKLAKIGDISPPYFLYIFSKSYLKIFHRKILTLKKFAYKLPFAKQVSFDLCLMLNMVNKPKTDVGWGRDSQRGDQ